MKRLKLHHPLRFIPTPSAKELGITFRTGIGITYVTTIRNRHSETVSRALDSRNSVLGPKFPPGAVCTSTLTDVPSGQTWIFIRPGVGTAREAPIQNRHLDSVDKWSHSEISGPAPKFLSGITVAGCRCDRIRTPLRSNGHNFSLGYQNRLQDPNSEAALRGARRPIIASGDNTSFQGRKTFISHSEITILADDLPYSKVFWQERLPRLCKSLAEPTRGAALSQRSEVVFNSTRDLLPRLWIWVPEHH
ncbi:hypothetical protein Taro_034190 [Colocasia esculenta]|uniref:Uncharacterized protein n=1 Tax=Colocasia esculenta TaxID=4460 RepID=A0A843VX52_COLES|nr:hypothetical protein [Colocasia esculenta]